MTCNYRLLYEGVILGVKNVLMEIQRRRSREKNFLRERLVQREEYIKGVFGENTQQWFDAREAILRFDDVQLKERATKFREFLDSNNEKATKAFCRLSKEGGLCDDINQIKKGNGRAFDTEEERGNYITEFYSNIYKKRLDNILRIEDFLQGEWNYGEYLQRKKLNDAERQDLDQAVTMDEVKKALDGSNFESSSGWDGVTFRAIRKFWGVLSEPMLKMIQETFREGELMETFKLGLIKLIPKKGDAQKVGDWRPITLLCCGYKLISGIVANRLGKYLHKLIGRSQKGFMSNKNINTCTVNVMNSISRSWELGVPTGVMCVDFAKAFDSIEHAMIQNVLEFFGFGGVMCGMVMTLLNDRKSKIIFGSGYSGDIAIERGTPQGDRSSPYIFILCIEILLMKINLLTDNGIDDSGLYIDIVRREMNEEKPTSEAYADDLTIIFRMNNSSVGNILEMLRDFERVSGLEINISKTQLMVTGSNEWDVGTKIHGIDIVDKVTILGIDIDRNLTNLEINWEKAILKMQRLCGYWATFGLSITGRVMVAKTYILSQCIYLMGSLPMSTAIGDRINEILLHYVKGRDRLIERRRQLLGPTLGGYGLMNVNTMNTCMKAAWIERWKRELPEMDYMAATVLSGHDGYGIKHIRHSNILGKGLRIMENIIEAWTMFKRRFYEWGNNINRAEIFGNEALSNTGECIEELVFGNVRYQEISAMVEGKLISDICNDTGELLEKARVDQKLDVRLTWVEYFRLRGVMHEIAIRLPRKQDGMCAEFNLEEFTSGRRRGCKRYRKVFDGRHSVEYARNTPMAIAAGRTLWGGGMDQMGRGLVEMNYGLWSCSVLDAGYKEFLFKLVHGKLYLNNQLAHFVDVENKCSFCLIHEKKLMKSENVRDGSGEYVRRVSNLMNETIGHLLWDCRWVNEVIRSAFNKITGERDELVNRSRYMGGWEIENVKLQEVMLILIHFVKYCIYICRNRRVLPSVTFITYELEELMGLMKKRIKWQRVLQDVRGALRGIFED